MDDKTRIMLDHPITIDGKPVAEVFMRRPKVKDVQATTRPGQSEADQEVALFSRLCNMNPEDLAEMDMADYGRMQETYLGFLSRAGRSSDAPASS